jgi:hypothetical protein
MRTRARNARDWTPHHVVVDGSNLATEGRTTPSFAALGKAVDAFRREHPEAILTVVVDASFVHRVDESERAAVIAAEAAHQIVAPPAGAIGRGDGFLLQIADRTGASVLSNDSFQEFQDEYEWLFDLGRLVGAKPVPEVGWIFSLRSPVRSTTRRDTTEAAAAARAQTTLDRVIADAADDAMKPVPRRRRRRSPPPGAVNDPDPFIAFVVAHPLGTEITGRVDRFSSHGAFVQADSVVCYVPLSGLGDPPPRRTRDVLSRGEVRSFVVQAFDPARRGVELALPAFAHPTARPCDETVDAEVQVTNMHRGPEGTNPRRQLSTTGGGHGRNS